MQPQVTLESLLFALNIPQEDCLNLYQTGSRVYGTAVESSDWDFVMVVSNTFQIPKDYLETG